MPADTRPDVVVVGAGVVGAACALACAEAGLEVLVLDRGGVASGTTASGEGNILVSDKAPGPELDLALLSRRLWLTLPDRVAAHGVRHDIELDAKGGLVVTRSPAGADRLHRFAASQRAAGVDAEPVDAVGLRALEPYLAGDVGAGVHYPQDLQCQPMLATAAMIAAARSLGAQVRVRTAVLAVTTARSGAVTGVRLPDGEVHAAAVVNAAGTWGAEVAALAGVSVPVAPRRGFILVTAPVPPLVRHKVYDADYVGDVASGAAGLQSSAVVEGTRSGPVLIGASREIVGFEGRFDHAILATLARQAVALFPVLAGVQVLRAYRGFRPFSPDHLPTIGADDRVPGLFHACGHEGAGIGLAPATGLLVAEAVTGSVPSMDVTPFAAARFGAARAVPEAG